MRANSATVSPGQTAKVTVNVADAGRPVAGARVTVLGRVKASLARQHRLGHQLVLMTDRHGRLRLRLGPFRHTTVVGLLVAKPGYTSHILQLPIRVHR